MQPQPKQIVSRGLVAGLIGATVLAVWFLVIDIVQGRPFYTPAFLSNILLRTDVADRSVALISLYTVLHYSAFAVTGVAVAWLVSKLEASPPIILGLVLGFVLFDVVFYTSVVITGVDVVQELGWPQVLAGNLFAGLFIMTYLHLSLGLEDKSWIVALTQHRVVREGLTVGLVGGVVVAVWFLVFDLARGQIFFTPGALGSVIFRGATFPPDIHVNFLTVGGYTIVHFAAFFAVGLVAAAIALQAEKAPPLLLAGLLLFATFEALFLGLLAVVAEWLLGALGWVVIGLGNLLATVAMATYLLWAHPALRAALGRETLSAEDIELPAPEVRDRP